MSVPEFELNELVNVIFLIDNDEIDKYNAKIIKVNTDKTDKTYDVLINNFDNKNNIYNNVIVKNDINDKFTGYSYKNEQKTLEIQNIKPFHQSPSGGASITKKLLINITKLKDNDLSKTTPSISQPIKSTNQPPREPTANPSA